MLVFLIFNFWNLLILFFKNFYQIFKTLSILSIECQDDKILDICFLMCTKLFINKQKWKFILYLLCSGLYGIYFMYSRQFNLYSSLWNDYYYTIIAIEKLAKLRNASKHYSTSPRWGWCLYTGWHQDSGVSFLPH